MRCVVVNIKCKNILIFEYFWIKVVEMDEKYNESSQWFVLSLALSVVPATSSDVKKSFS